MAGQMQSKRRLCWLIYLLASTSCALGDGLGSQYIWAHDTDTDNQVQDDAIFKPKLEEDGGKFVGNESNQTAFCSVKDEFETILRAIKIELVVPGKHLLKIMNIISTKTRAMFFQDYERYFEKLNVGSASRPMLLSYLGLELADHKQLATWLAPQLKFNAPRLRDSCKSLAEYRQNALNLNPTQLDTLDKCKSSAGGKFHLAYLVFQNNLNLFMLDTYLMLCRKLFQSDHQESFNVKLFF